MPNIDKSKSFVQRMKEMDSVSIPSLSYEGNGIPSLSIVYGKNGKRITISKTLARRLNITGEAFVFPIVEDSVLLFAKNMPEDKGIKLKFKGDDKKVSYNSGAIEYFVKEFKLDYSDVSSKAFNKITFEQDGDIEYAIVSMIDPKPENDEEKSSDNS